MRALSLTLLAALAITLTPAVAEAWVASQTCGGNTPVRWASGSTTWKLRDKLSGANNFYSRLTDAQVSSAVDAGWTVFENPSSCGSDWSATYGGTTTTSALTTNSEDVVEFFETGWPAGYGSVNSTIAVTVNWRQGCDYTDADQIYNAVGFQFTVANNPGWNDTDLQSIAAHENGHWLGLDHTPIQSATMYASYSGGIGSRSLHADDEAGVCALYPGAQGPTETNCTNGIDDDADGAVDCLDTDCSSTAACVCVATAALPCNGTRSGTTVGRSATVLTYSCANWNETGPEAVYTLTTPVSGAVTVNMTNLTADLDLFITTGTGSSCNANACIDLSGTENLSDESVTWNATAGTTYFIVADGYENAAGSFTLSSTCPGGTPTTETNCSDGLDDDGDGAVDCADSNCNGDPACSGLECASQATLSCNSTRTGNTFGGPNDVESWPCVGWTTTGPEAVYAFTPPTSGQVTLDLTGLSADVDLFLTTNGGGACDPDGCIGASGELNNEPEQIVFSATGGTTYYVVIDAWEGATSAFSLEATCTGGGSTTETSCSDGLDNDGDGAFDCDDSDCNGDPACTGDCTNAGACCDVADPGSCVECELYLVADGADPEALCSCACEVTADCPDDWECIDIGDGDSACWPGENLCLGEGDDDDDDATGDDDDAVDDDDDDGGGGGRSTCGCDATAVEHPTALAFLALLGALGAARRRL